MSAVKELKVLIVTPDGEMRRETFRGDTLRALQQAVGGYIEAAPLDRDDATIFINEEGKLEGYEINPLATAIWYSWAPFMRGHDVLVGTAVFAGGVDDEGDTLSLPDELADAIEAGVLAAE